MSKNTQKAQSRLRFEVLPLEAVLLLAKVPFEVFFAAALAGFFLGFIVRSVLVVVVVEFLPCAGQAATLADIVLSQCDVLHLSAAFWTIIYHF
jgi:hypothetical protein